MSRPRLIALLLAVVTLAVYLPVVRNGFVSFDDGDYLTNNPVVQAGWTSSGFLWAFTTDYANNWHPLTWLSHMTDCQIFKLNPAGHHFVNALIHALNSALIFLFLLRLTGKSGPSLFMAALFAWHPLHVESVAWASERKDTLSTFFALLALLCYLRFAQSKAANLPIDKISAEHAPNQKPAAPARPALRTSSLHYWSALTFFALGLMAKPMLVTLPFVFLLLDFWPLKRFSLSAFRFPLFFRLFVEKIPFFILTVASCLVTYRAQNSDVQGHSAILSLHDSQLDLRAANLPLSLAGYLVHLFWPAGLCVFYPLPRNLDLLQVMVAPLTLLGISVTAWHWRAPRPYFLMGWLWFLGTLVPVIGIVQVGSQAMADRYTYIPSIGFFIAAVLLVAEIAEKIRFPKIILTTLAILICAACIFATERQTRTWQDSESLFRQATKVADSDTARTALGAALIVKNEPVDAIMQFRRGIEINPARAELYNDLAVALSGLDQPADALAAFRSALKLVPQDASKHYGAGYELSRLGRNNEALAEFAIATNLAPLYALPHIQTAHIYYQIGRDSEGAAELLLATRLQPHDWQLLADAAHYLAADQDPAARDGATAAQLALAADQMTGGNVPFVTDILAMAYAETGDFNNAIAAEQRALATAKAQNLTGIEPAQHRLNLFQNHLPWHESFRHTDTH